MSWLHGPLAAYAATSTDGPLDGRRITAAALLTLEDGTWSPRTWTPATTADDGHVAASITSSLTAVLSCQVPVIVADVSALTVLDRQSTRHSGDTLTTIFAEEPEYPIAVIDPVLLHRHFAKATRSLSLPNLASSLGIQPPPAADVATVALLAARITWRLAHTYPMIGALAAVDLHRRQVRWAAEHLRHRPAGHPPADLWPVWLPSKHATQATAS